MIQNATIRTSQAAKVGSLLFVQGLSWIGGLGLLSTGIGLAQTTANETSVTDPAPVQSAEMAPVEVAPQPMPAAPESFPSEFSTPSTDPYSESFPPIPNPGIGSNPPAIAPQNSNSSGSGSSGSGPSDYDAPGSIVFSERSTGCRATVASGQTPNGICSVGGSLTGSNVAGTTSLSGATRLPGGLSAVQVGSFVVNSTGLGLATTPSVRDFYRRTLRPPGRLGNSNIKLMFPLAIPAAISSVFGWRLHPISGDARFHTGTDLAAPMGTPVLAAFAGQVAISDFLGGYGLTVALEHNKGTEQTLYAHLSEIFVQPGDLVKQGEVIGRVGSTGNSTGAHLHFEFRQLTPDGWVALDAGAQLEYGLAQLMKSLEFAQAPSTSAKANAGIQGVLSGQ